MLDAHFRFYPGLTSGFTTHSTVTDSDTSQSPKIEICSSSSPYINDTSNGRKHHFNHISHQPKKSSSFSVETLLKNDKSSSSSSEDPSLLFSLSNRSVSNSTKDFDPCHFSGLCSEPCVVKYNQRTLCTLREWNEHNRNVYRNGLNSNMIVRQSPSSDLKFSVQSILANNQLNGEPKYELTQFKPRGKFFLAFWFFYFICFLLIQKKILS